MKNFRKIKIAIIVTILLTISCSGKTLAKYSAGKITKEELSIWADLNNIAVDYDNENQIKNTLMNMAELMILASEAEKIDFSEKTYIKIMLSMATDNTLVSQFLKDDYLKREDCRLKTYEVSHIFVSDKNKNAAKKTDEIMSLLNKGNSFNEIAAEYSEDITGNNSGRLGYVLKGMLPGEYYDLLNKLKPNEVNKLPVKTDKGYYIIRLDSVKIIPVYEFFELEKNKQHSERLQREAERLAVESLLTDLKNNSKVVYNPDNLFKEGDLPLFEIGNKKFTKKSFNLLIKYYNKIYKKDIENTTELNNAYKRNLLLEIFELQLMKQYAYDCGYDRNKKYLKEKEIIRRNILGNEYKSYLLNSSEVKISQDEIKYEYNKNKDFLYSITEEKDGKFYQKHAPLKQVEKVIIHKLKSDKKNKNYKKTISNLKRKYKLEVLI